MSRSILSLLIKNIS